MKILERQGKKDMSISNELFGTRHFSTFWIPSNDTSKLATPSPIVQTALINTYFGLS